MIDIGKIEKGIYALLEGHLHSDLTYHTKAHTQDVVDIAMKLSNIYRLPEKERLLLRIAALYHDTGFLKTYKGHEKESIGIFHDHFGSNTLARDEKARIEGMIMATRIPQSPQNFLEKIICDADLDYLGRPDFYTTGDLLYKEFLDFGFVEDRNDWNQVQIDFLSQHEYHTGYAKLVRGPRKAEHLEELKNMPDSN